MNQSQIKYARERSEAIFKKREALLRKVNTTPAARLTVAQKVDALRKGAFTVLDATNVRGNPYSLSDYVDFGETQEVFNSEGFEAAFAPLRDAYRVLLDNLVLGDATEALAFLSAFEGDA